MTLKEVIIAAFEEKKGANLTVCDFENQGYIVDAYLIADAPSIRQVAAIVDQIEESVKKAGYTIYRIEGGKESRWILVDCGDVVAHIFQTEERGVYQLERLWADACKLK